MPWKILKNFMPSKIILDANFLVGFFDQKDRKHPLISQIAEELKNKSFDAVYFDFIVNEVISVICKRFTEQKRAYEIQAALSKIAESLHKDVIFWSGSYLKE